MPLVRRRSGHENWKIHIFLVRKLITFWPSSIGGVSNVPACQAWLVSPCFMGFGHAVRAHAQKLNQDNVFRFGSTSA